MLTIPLATSFLAGAILTLLVPACLLIAIVVWHGLSIRRVHEHDLTATQPPGTPPPVVDEELPKL